MDGTKHYSRSLLVCVGVAGCIWQTLSHQSLMPKNILSYVSRNKPWSVTLCYTGRVNSGISEARESLRPYGQTVASSERGQNTERGGVSASHGAFITNRCTIWKDVIRDVTRSVSHSWRKGGLCFFLPNTFSPTDSKLQWRHTSQRTWKQSVFLFQPVVSLEVFSMFGLAGPVPAPEGWSLSLARFWSFFLSEGNGPGNRWSKWATVMTPKHKGTEAGGSWQVSGRASFVHPSAEECCSTLTKAGRRLI